MPDLAAEVLPLNLPIPTQIHSAANGPPCIHLAGRMPNILVVARTAVERLNFQLRVMCPPQSVLAARRGDTLTLAVHSVTSIIICNPTRARNADCRIRGPHWHYQLTEWPERPDVLIATQVVATPFEPGLTREGTC